MNVEREGYAPCNVENVTKTSVDVFEPGNTKLPFPPFGSFDSIAWNRKAGDESENIYRATFPHGEHGAAAKRLARRIVRGIDADRDWKRLERAR